MLWLVLACTIVPYRGGSPAPVAPDPVALADAGAATGQLVANIDALLATTDDVDRRDRLVELRDLALAADALDPAIRGRVLSYVARAIAIEGRAAPVSVEEPLATPGAPGGAPIIVEESIAEAPIPEVPAPTPEPPPAPAPVPAP